MFNADQTIGILVSQLVKNGAQTDQITIHSFDSDMMIYGQGAIIQCGKTRYL